MSRKTNECRSNARQNRSVRKKMRPPRARKSLVTQMRHHEIPPRFIARFAETALFPLSRLFRDTSNMRKKKILSSYLIIVTHL